MMCNRLFVFQALNKILIAGFSSTVPKASAQTSHAHCLAAVSSIMYSIILYFFNDFSGAKLLQIIISRKICLLIVSIMAIYRY